eukprot:CAMPEP_0168546916 /NCGR_PEP_ID=MMETSP0413-20121227/3752_1 /TAXON_ID=136452 /ORGANISM="Filamoeba nolandi, Strain NC-AS-23-1" /LENGTH=426 /DNA_ID=CAMNT_0008577123 /DNA_START=153 /DNA_END=1433 /DNA_ORIENTATION=+
MVKRLVKGADVATLIQENFGMMELDGEPFPVIASEYQTRYLPEELFANLNLFDDDEALLVDIWTNAVKNAKGVMPSPGNVRRASEMELKRRRRKNDVMSSPKTPKPKSEHTEGSKNNNNNNVSTQEHYATEYDDGEFKYVASSPMKSPPLSQQYRSSQGEDPVITELFKTPPQKQSKTEFATLENISEGLRALGGEATGTDLLEWMVKTFHIPQNQKSSYFRRLNVLLGKFTTHFTKVGVLKISENKITSVWRLNSKKDKKRHLEEPVAEEDDEVPLQLKKQKQQQSPPSSQTRSQETNDHSLPSTPKIEKSKAPRIHNDDLLGSQPENNNNNQHQHEEERPSQKASPAKRQGSNSSQERKEDKEEQRESNSQTNSSPVKRQNSSSQEKKEDGLGSPSKRHQNSRQSSQERPSQEKSPSEEVEDLK